MSSSGAFLACKRLQPEVVAALKRNNAGLDKVIGKMVRFMDDEDHQVGVRATAHMLNVHGVLGNGDGHDGSKAGTNVMVIIGATDERIAALRAGDAIEARTSDSSKRPTENVVHAAEGNTSSDDHSA